MSENPSDRDERDLSAGDVRKTAGLTYRQLNDWDSRGAVPGANDRGTGWRRFSPREVFALMVCAEIRRRLGVPVERVRFVQKFMLQEGADHLRAAAELMATLGVGVWLVTDLEAYFEMDSEMEFVDQLSHGLLGSDETRTLVWIKVNPLVNRLLSCLKEPINLPSHGRGYETLREIRDRFAARSPEELEVLQLIRSGDFDKLEIVLKDGEIRTIHTKQSVSEPDAKDLAELIREHEYQTLTVTKRDGKIVSINQSVPHKTGA